MNVVGVEQMIKIRLTRKGRIHKPVYSIVAIDSRSARDSRSIEVLGQYNPSSEEGLKDLQVEKIASWINKGAVLSDTVRSLLKKNNIKFDSYQAQ